MDFKKEIARAISVSLAIDEKKALELIEKPRDKKFGDFSIPCFALCKKGEKASEKAKELLKKIKKPKGIAKSEVVGPYINFFIDENALAEKCIKKILKEKENYGKIDIGENKRVMIEYSAPNANKPLHLGHLRNDCIGMAISNLFEFNGYKVIRANLVNDRGIHICQAMLSFKRFGKSLTPKKAGLKGDRFVGDFYVKFNEKAKEEPALKSKAIEMLKKWEEKDKETIELWKKMRSWVLDGFKQTYKKFGSRFDYVFFESDYYNKAKPLIELGLKKGVFERTRQGAIIARLEKHGLPDKTVLRADGTSIYITNDLALTKYKQEAFHLHKNIFCVANEQDLYFKQLFKILELLGFPWAKNCEHLSYGLVFLPEGKMKSREGKIIDADDLIASVQALAEKEVRKRFKNLSKSETEKRAEAIALAAIKFAMLRIDHRKNFTFLPEKSISFEGESGPYLQYTYARAKSILRKAGKKAFKKIDFSKLSKEKEREIVKTLAFYPKLVKTALEKRSIHLLCHFLLGLAETFNAYYHETRVIGSGKAENARLALVKAVSIVLKSGLLLLNIPVLEEM